MSFSIQYQVKSLQLFCPPGLEPKLLLKEYTTSISCDISCPEAYTFQAGNMSVDVIQKYHHKVGRNISHSTSKVECFPCPVGAVCDGSVQALPKYWGYINQNNSVTIIRCPEGYCCQDNDTCRDIDSCNIGRTGTLCGNCLENLTEQNCYGNLILFLYFFCALIYTIFLLFIETLKNKAIQIFKRLSKCIKMKCLHADDSGLPSMTKSNKDASNSSGMKYIQILLFYIQDATLFKVPLPDDSQSESFFVKVIQFSPDVLASFLTKASDTCFKAGSPAVIKIIFQSLFGPSVMAFIFLIYFIQNIFSKCCINHSLTALKSMLIQALLLALLFSLQKMIIGAFTLIQCVDVGEKKVLYIQGDIECYTWWQVVIQIIIFGNVIPVLFVISLAPFYVENKTMSTKFFIFACILPIPSLIYIIIIQQAEGRKVEGNRIEGNISSKNVNETDNAHCKYYSGPENVEIPFIDEDSVSEERKKRTEHKDLDRLYRDQETQTNGSSVLYEISCSTKDPETIDVIVHTLLEQYKPLCVCGVYFTWLVIHIIYRVVLVAYNTYVTEPLQRFWFMIIILLLVLIANIFLKPYKESRANKAAILSYTANLCIAIINISKTMLATFDCKTNCSLKINLIWYFSLTENILMIYLPVGAFVCWLISVGVKKCKSKSKDE